MEEGIHVLEDGTLVEAGTFRVPGVAPQSVFFDGTFAVPPVVVCTVASFDGAEPAAGRLDQITSSGFRYMLQEQEANADGHTVETVCYVAWEPSAGELQGLGFEVDRTYRIIDESYRFLMFGESFVDPPAFLADMQTMSEPDTATLRYDYKDTFLVEVMVAEERSYDSETSHSTEKAGYILLGPTRQ
jgi:hypothetical protein